MIRRARTDPVLDRERALYQERMLRRLYVRAPGWDAHWKPDDLKAVNDLHDGSVSRILGYRDPVVVPDDQVDRHPVVGKDADDTLMHGLARLQVVRREPSRQQEVFGWRTPAAGDGPGLRAFERAKTDYWLRILGEPLEQMHLLKDTADFKANYLLRLLYLHGQTPPALRSVLAVWRDPADLDRDVNFSAEVEQRFAERFLHFKYWLDEPFAAGDPARPGDGAAIQAARRAVAAVDQNRFDPGEVEAEMTYWSENHTVLFGVAEYLAGQRWPDEVFRPGALFRPEGPDAVRPGDLTGAQHVERAGARLRRWLDDRLRFGFSEWNAPGYYEEDLGALFNLADFALEEDLRVRAGMALDLLLFDLARLSHLGSFGVTAGRAYFEHKSCGYEQATGDLAQLLFGRRGTYVGGSSESAGCYASSSGYEVPPVLLRIGRDQPAGALDRRRVSLDPQEGPAHGIGTRTEDDVLRWWTRGAYFITQVADASDAVVRRRFLSGSNPFRDILPMLRVLGFAHGVVTGKGTDGTVGDGGDDLSVFTEGSALTQARLTTWRTRHTMLSSVRGFHPQQLNFQSQYAQATLGMGATVWTTHPSAGASISTAEATAAGVGAGAAVGAGVGSVFGPPGAVVGGIVGAIGGGLAGFFGSGAGDGIALFPAGHDGPNWWTGSVTVPMTAQHEGAVVLAYSPRAIQSTLFGHRTHAWFPTPAFDEGSVQQRFAADSNVPFSLWTFGRRGDGYVALWSARTPSWSTDGPWADRELVAEGDGNVFVLQVGDRDGFGSYTAFVEEVAAARIHVSDLGDDDVECSYDVPRGGRLELHGEPGQARYDGRVLPDRFPRWQSPYVVGGRVGARTYRYTIRHADRSLHHDFTDLRTHGTGGRRLREVDGPADDLRDLAFLVVARRGAASVLAENTLEACRLAVQVQGANALLVDACLTADGRLALWHDPDPEAPSAVLRRVGLGGTGRYLPTAPPLEQRRPVAQLALAQLQAAYGYASPDPAAPSAGRIPDLQELLTAGLDGLVHVLVHLHGPATAGPVLRALGTPPAGLRVTLLSEDPALLRALRTAGGPALLGWAEPVPDPGAPPTGAVAGALAVGADVALARPGSSFELAGRVPAEAAAWDAFDLNASVNRGAQLALLLAPADDAVGQEVVVDEELSGGLTDDVPGLLRAVRRAGLPTG